MAKIPEKQLERLNTAGLFVSKPARETHVMPGFVFINKPIAVPGNSIPNYEVGYGLDGKLEFNSPFLRLFFDVDQWVVLGVDHSPVPGPGDFITEWDSAEEAVSDIIDFYFGDPARMNEKAKKNAEFLARLNASKKEQ